MDDIFIKRNNKKKAFIYSAPEYPTEMDSHGPTPEKRPCFKKKEVLEDHKKCLKIENNLSEIDTAYKKALARKNLGLDLTTDNFYDASLGKFQNEINLEVYEDIEFLKSEVEFIDVTIEYEFEDLGNYEFEDVF